MLVWRLNLAWKSGHPNQCLRLGDDAKTDRTLGARFREGASHSNPLSEGAAFAHLLTPSSRVSLRSTVGYYRENGTRRGSELFKFHYDSGPVAQRLEQGTHNPLVPGSNPGGPIFNFRFSIGDLQSSILCNGSDVLRCSVLKSQFSPRSSLRRGARIIRTFLYRGTFTSSMRIVMRG